MVTQMTVSTDAQDYVPGSWVEITATGFDPGSTVTFQVQHAGDSGADGIWGTLDDVIVDLGGEGHDGWSVTDGGEFDLDGAANGTVVTSWYVNPDDSLNWHFLLTAMAAGQQTASAGFTDSAGSYTLKWYASDPAIDKAPYLPTYEKLSPGLYIAGGYIYPLNSADPPTDNPLDEAVTYGSIFNTHNLDAVTSLAPKDMALGQIVPFQMEIKVTGDTTAENGVITFTSEWLAKTTSGGNFGFDTNYKVIAAFVDTGDAGNQDSGVLASVDQFQSIVVNGGTHNEAILGTFQVSGLDNGDNVIVEIWVVLDDTIPEGATGNVQTSLFSARTGAIDGTGSTISTGNQTVPLLRVQEFFSSDADISVIKSDSVSATTNATDLTSGNDVDPANLKPGDTFTYTIQVTNNSTTTVSNGIVVTDTLDPNLTFVSATLGGTFSDNGSGADTVIWNLTSLSQGESQLLHVTVIVNDTASTSSAADLMNTVTVTSITTDPDTANNTNTESTDLITVIKALHIEKSATLADGGEKADSTDDLINYRMEVTNTGNSAIAGVLVSDAFTSNEAPVLAGIYNIGDLDEDSLLDVDEVWLYTASHQVTQEELDSGAPIVNTAVASGMDAASDDDDAAVEVLQRPALQIEKQISLDGSNWLNADDATGPIVNVGQTVYFRVVVVNSGNVTLTDVDVKDEVTTGTGSAIDFTFDSGNQLINSLAPNVTVISDIETVQALSGQQTDLATAFATFSNGEVQATDYANYFGKPPVTALIAPTDTTVWQYLDGSYQSFQEYYDYQGGVIQYNVSLKTGKIIQTNPGVFFYYTGASGDITAAAGTPLEITIDQTLDPVSAAMPSFNVLQKNIILYRVLDANGNGVYDTGETVSKVSNYTQTMLNGDITLNVTAQADSFYIVSVKYDTSAVTGTMVGKDATAWPTVNYQFDTWLKVGSGSSALIETYEGGVDLAPKKTSPMLLEGDEGNGARAVNDAQIKHVINAAICWWEEQGIAAEQLAQLEAATVEIADLGEDDQGWMLGASSGSFITIDDDAADHGWSLGLGDVAHNKVDLFSVLVHEMGHVLSKTDEEMGTTLAVGERMLPTLSVTPPEDADDQGQIAASSEDHSDYPAVEQGIPTVEHMLGLLGTHAAAAAAAQMQLHMG